MNSDDFIFAEKLAEVAGKYQADFQEAGNNLALLEKQLSNICIRTAESMIFGKDTEKLSILLNFSKINALVGTSLIRTVHHLTGLIFRDFFVICRPWQIRKKTVLLTMDQLIEKEELNKRIRTLKRIGLKEFSNVRGFLRGLNNENTAS